MPVIDQRETLLVIPLFNHAAMVRDVVSKALHAGWTVLVVDDGSTDDGAGCLFGLPCHVLSMTQNQGKGAAIKRGLRYASENGYKAIITVDADGQLDPREALLLLEEARKEWPCLVIGARMMESSNAPKASIFGNHFSNLWVRIETGKVLPDTQSGFRLYPVKEMIEISIRSNRYDFEIESLVRAVWAGVHARSTPVSVHYPSRKQRISHFHQFKDNFRLTVLHTLLVLRTLLPLPHKKIVKADLKERAEFYLFHPISLVKRLCQEHNSALQLAVAAWVGFFLGALPLIAVHTIVIIYVSHRLHLNKIAAVAASQFCAPPIMPFFCIQAGFWLRTGHFLTEASKETILLQIHQRLWEWLLGSLLVGPLGATLVSVVAYVGIKKVRKLYIKETFDPENSK